MTRRLLILLGTLGIVIALSGCTAHDWKRAGYSMVMHYDCVESGANQPGENARKLECFTVQNRAESFEDYETAREEALGARARLPLKQCLRARRGNLVA